MVEISNPSLSKTSTYSLVHVYIAKYIFIAKIPLPNRETWSRNEMNKLRKGKKEIKRKKAKEIRRDR